MLTEKDWEVTEQWRQDVFEKKKKNNSSLRSFQMLAFV